MKKVGKDAALHEKSVQAVAKGEVTPRRRKRSANKVDPNGEVSHIRVLPEVWAKALEVCGGDTSRIQVVASDDVVIHNKPRPHKAT